MQSVHGLEHFLRVSGARKGLAIWLWRSKKTIFHPDSACEHGKHYYCIQPNSPRKHRETHLPTGPPSPSLFAFCGGLNQPSPCCEQRQSAFLNDPCFMYHDDYPSEQIQWVTRQRHMLSSKITHGGSRYQHVLTYPNTRRSRSFRSITRSWPQGASLQEFQFLSENHEDGKDWSSDARNATVPTPMESKQPCVRPKTNGCKTSAVADKNGCKTSAVGDYSSQELILVSQFEPV